MREKLDVIQDEIQKGVTETADKTIDKLKEMNPEIAKQLTPDFSKPSWEKAFQFTLKSDDQIPLDKRGSGVRRLILLNFFRAEAERKRGERKTPNVIYALEEPETSLHPDHQRKLIEAFLQLAAANNDQVILTTHSPGIAKLIPPDSLILLRKVKNIVELYRGSDDILREIAEVLGVLPDIQIDNVPGVRLAICVEGKNDIHFLENINEGIPDFNSLVNLKSNPHIIKIPMGGSTLQYWINNDYLGKLKLNQFHIYDSDKGSDSPHKYTKYVIVINAKGKGVVAYETQKREFENYFHQDLIKTKFGCDIKCDDWDCVDIPEEIAKYNLAASGSTKNWEDLKDEDKKERKRKIKNQLNETHSKEITKDMLVKLKAYEEVIEWFKKIAELAG